MRTSPEEGIKPHRFAGILPEQFFTEAGRHREAVVATDERMVIRCYRDDLAGFVHDVSHVRHPLSVLGFMLSPKRKTGCRRGRRPERHKWQSQSAASMMEARFWVKCHFGRSRATALIWIMSVLASPQNDK